MLGETARSFYLASLAHTHVILNTSRSPGHEKRGSITYNQHIVKYLRGGGQRKDEGMFQVILRTQGVICLAPSRQICQTRKTEESENL